MFVVVQIPFADLRMFAKDAMGRLAKPDWNADDPGDAFIRGFGRMSTRNSGGLGLAGERAFADFRQAVLFEEPVAYRQSGWPVDVRIRPWFRRLYFDGGIAGRLEFGFLVTPSDEAVAFQAAGASRPNPASIAERILSTPVRIRSSELPDQTSSLARSGDSIGLAYLAATTERGALYSHPIAETMGQYFLVGRPTAHVRLSSVYEADLKNDAREVHADADGRLYASSMALKNQHYPLLVQQSSRDTQDESGQERALRVLFSHLNSLIFAASVLIEKKELFEGGTSKRTFQELTERMVTRFSDFVQTGPRSNADDAFAAAIKAFGAAHVGRAENLAAKLADLAAGLGKQTSFQRAALYGKTLFELVLTTAVKATVEVAAKPR